MAECDMAGNAYKLTDPRSVVTQYSFDMLGRKTQEIDGATGSPATGEAITNWTYDGDNNVLTMQAVFPGTSTPSQTTAYILGIGGTSATNLFSNDVIAKVEYPDKTTGNTSTSASNDVSYGYNLQAQVTSMTDQNGTAAEARRRPKGERMNRLLNLGGNDEPDGSGRHGPDPAGAIPPDPPYDPYGVRPPPDAIPFDEPVWSLAWGFSASEACDRPVHPGRCTCGADLPPGRWLEEDRPGCRCDDEERP